MIYLWVVFHVIPSFPASRTSQVKGLVRCSWCCLMVLIRRHCPHQSQWIEGGGECHIGPVSRKYCVWIGVWPAYHQDGSKEVTQRFVFFCMIQRPRTRDLACSQDEQTQVVKQCHLYTLNSWDPVMSCCQAYIPQGFWSPSHVLMQFSKTYYNTDALTLHIMTTTVIVGG